jgi:hypothetical protein
MGDSILKLNCEVTCDTEGGIEIRFRHGGSLPRGFTEHLARAGEEVLLALEQLAGPGTGQTQEKVRTKIDIEEA